MQTPDAPTMNDAPGDTTTLLIVRHGQTEWNALGRIQGASNTPLNAIGIEQARRIARRLATTPVAAVYSSDLSRAADTARIIRERFAAAGEVPLRLSPRLREIAYGDWEGRTREELEATGWGDALRRWQAGCRGPLPEGAETREQADARIDEFLACVVPRHAGETVVIVGHGGTLRLMLCRLLGLPPERWGRVRLANTSLSKAVLAPGRRPSVPFVNDTAHLRGMPGGRRLAGPLQSAARSARG